MIIPKAIRAITQLILLASATALVSCASPTLGIPMLTPAGDGNGDIELTPAGDGDIDLMLARFAKALHLIADLNENGEVTYQELLRVSADADDEKFRSYDTDESGGLSLEETTTAITKGEVAAKLIAKFDPNGNGEIDASEAAKFDAMIDATEGLRNFVEVEHLFAL